MRNKFFPASLLCLFLQHGLAQSVGVGTSSPHPSARLDIIGGNKGLLIPRVGLSTINDVITIPGPAVSLLVYNNNPSITGGDGVGYYSWTGLRWTKIITSDTPLNGWNETGNNGTDPT